MAPSVGWANEPRHDPTAKTPDPGSAVCAQYSDIGNVDRAMALHNQIEPLPSQRGRTAFLSASLGKLRARALPPSFAGEDSARAGLPLFVLTLGLMTMATVSLIQAWVHRWTGPACTQGAEDLCLIAASWLNRRGEIEKAAKIVCFSELICGLLVISFFGAGFSDEALLLFPLVLVTAAILLDWRQYIGFAGLVVVSVTSIGAVLAAAGAVGTRYHRVANVLNILLVTAVAVGLLARNLKRSVFESREAEREIRALSGRLINAQEQERTRVARELHDDISQQIAALSIATGNLKTDIPAAQAGARAQSDRLQQKLAGLAESVRRLSHELHPAVLEHAGLAAALRAYCSEFSSLTGVRVALEAEGSLEGAPITVSLCIFRIVQEALQNVAKHAHVTDASVHLIRARGYLSLTIADRGAGMAPERAGTAGGLGLVSIRERTRLVNGAVHIQSAPNRGTTIAVTIPADDWTAASA
jgi:signal transduction histidine kinase